MSAAPAEDTARPVPRALPLPMAIVPAVAYTSPENWPSLLAPADVNTPVPALLISFEPEDVGRDDQVVRRAGRVVANGERAAGVPIHQFEAAFGAATQVQLPLIVAMPVIWPFSPTCVIVSFISRSPSRYQQCRRRS